MDKAKVWTVRWPFSPGNDAFDIEDFDGSPAVWKFYSLSEEGGLQGRGDPTGDMDHIRFFKNRGDAFFHAKGTGFGGGIIEEWESVEACRRFLTVAALLKQSGH